MRIEISLCFLSNENKSGVYYISLQCGIRENLESLRRLGQSLTEVQDLLFSL